MTPNRHARLALALFCAGIFVVALGFERSSVESMDVRTYVQMISGVAAHALPYWDNGPIARFPELVVPWGVPAHGHIWGVYGPLYPYLAAPFFRMGSLAYVAKFTLMLMIPLAVVTFRLARRVAKSEWTATLAAVLAVAATPILGKSLELTAYPLAVVLATWATDATLAWQGGGHRPRGAIASGVLWAAATATHAVCLPMALVTIVVGSVGDDRIATARRAAFAFAAFVVALLPLAYLNHVRFDSWNPISYGPVPWALIDPNLKKQNIASQLAYAAPCIGYSIVVAGAFVALRARRIFVAPLIVAAALVPTLRDAFARYAKVAFGYVVDLSFLDLGGGYGHPPRGFGQLFDGWLVTSTLQVSPFLALAAVALARSEERRRLAIPFAAGAAVFAAMILRANMPLIDAFGYPWVYVRYTLTALPALACVSAIGIEASAPTRRHVALAAAVALAIALFLLADRDETQPAHQLVILALPLVVAAVALARRSAWAAALTVGVGLGVSGGHALAANMRAAKYCDAHAANVLAALPARYAVAGWTGMAEIEFSTAAVRDVQYADLNRLDDWRKVRALFEHWRDESRPTFVVWRGPRFDSPWSDLHFEEIAPGVHRLIWNQSASR